MSGGVETVADILRKAADLIEPEGAWTQGVFARDADGFAVRAESSSATCFCAVGAIFRSSPSSSLADRIVDNLKVPRGFSMFSDWNDAEGRTQAEVVAKLREAATLAQSAVQS